MRRYVADLAPPFPVLLDERGKVRRLYRLAVVPTAVMIDSGGVVRAGTPGPIRAESLRQGLDSILTSRD